MQEAALLHRGSALSADQWSICPVGTSITTGAGRRCAQMWNVLWEWVLGADSCHTDVRSFARFGERIVA